MLTRSAGRGHCCLAANPRGKRPALTIEHDVRGIEDGTVLINQGPTLAPLVTEL